MPPPNANPTGEGGAGGNADGFDNPSISRPWTSATLKAALLRRYGDLALNLIRLSGPKDRKASPGKRPLEKAWQHAVFCRKREGITPDSNAAKIAARFMIGENIGLAIPEQLVCLDGDTPEAVDWLDQVFPDAPRQNTGGGWLHVVLRVPAGALGAGERLSNTCGFEVAPGVRLDVRAHGSQIAVEPSIHVSGGKYTWLKPLPRNIEQIPELPRELLLKLPRKSDTTGTQSSGERLVHGVQDGSGTQSTQSPQSPHATQSITTTTNQNQNHEKPNREPPSAKTPVALNDEDLAEIESAIAATLPEIEGQRNHRLFLLASRLKAIGPLADLPGCHPVLYRIVEAWHARALPVIGTKDFETSWIEFLNAWPKANPFGWRFQQCASRARDNPDAFAFKVAGLLCIRNPKFVYLVALFCELDRLHDSGSWPLAGRLAADVLDVDPKTSAGWLQMLTRNKVLTMTKAANKPARLAAEYQLNRHWGAESS